MSVSVPASAVAVVAVGFAAAGVILVTATGTPPAATPAATPVAEVAVPLRDRAGKIAGVADIREAADGRVTIVVDLEGLAPGDHGIHVHSVGVCDPDGGEPFASAGPHFDPTEGSHGGPTDPESHAGDLGNVAAAADGRAHWEITTGKFTLSDGPATLRDADGSALVIHAHRDDLATDPDGASGPGVACGVIAPSPLGTPVPGTPAP